MSAGFSYTLSLCLPGFLPLPHFACRVFFHFLLMSAGFSSTLSLCLSGFLLLSHYVCRVFFHISATIFRISVPPNSLSNLRHVFSLISTTFPSSSSPPVCVFLIRLRYVFSSLFFHSFFITSPPPFRPHLCHISFPHQSPSRFRSHQSFLSHLRNIFFLIFATLSF